MTRVLIKSEKTEKELEAYCFFDNMADGSFISEDVREKLEGKGLVPEKVVVTTIMGEEKTHLKPVKGLQIISLDRKSKIRIPKAYSKEKLPVGPEDIASYAVLERWDHLRNLKATLPDFDPKVPIGLIVGQNCPRALEPIEVIQGEGPDQ